MSGVRTCVCVCVCMSGVRLVDLMPWHLTGVHNWCDWSFRIEEGSDGCAEERGPPTIHSLWANCRGGLHSPWLGMTCVWCVYMVCVWCVCGVCVVCVVCVCVCVCVFDGGLTIQSISGCLFHCIETKNKICRAWWRFSIACIWLVSFDLCFSTMGQATWNGLIGSIPQIYSPLFSK